MANTGADLINAIVKNKKLMALDNCPAVPVEMGRAVYGSVQDDDDPEYPIENGNKMQEQIDAAMLYRGTSAQSAVWHFLVTGPAVHHFVVIPWYQTVPAPTKQVYTVFMAYEHIDSTKEYSVQKYVDGTAPAPAKGGKGYKSSWSITEFSTMLSDLLTRDAAWQEYFGQVGVTQRATKITSWKYEVINLDTAIANVNKY